MGADEATDIERRLAPAWKRVCRIEGPDAGDRCVSLAGDLRAAEMIVEEIARAFNIRLSPNMVNEAATLRRVASLVEEALNWGPLSN